MNIHEERTLCEPPMKLTSIQRAQQKADAQASTYIRAALAELARIGPNTVGVGKGIMDAEAIIRAVLDDVENR